MRQNKDEVGNACGQPTSRGSASDWRCRGGLARRSLRLLGALILLGLLWSPAFAQRAGDQADKAVAAGDGAPLLLVTQTEIDLGDMPKGSSADARFELRNAGNADLHILDVRTGCSCTIAKYDEVIAPGEVGYVTATLMTETLNSRVSQGISLMTDDPTSPATFLLIRAQVVTAVRIIPEAQIVLRGLPDEQPVRRVVRRSADSGHGFFNIVGLESSAPWIAARARKVREAAPKSGDLPAVAPGDWILEIGLDGQPPLGKRREQIEFKTGLERQPVVWLEVHTNRRAPVQLPVERLLLQSRDGEAIETLSFTVRDGLDPSALRIDVPPGLTVQLEVVQGQAMTARVRWSGGKLDGGRLEFSIEGERYDLPVIYEPPR